MLAARHDDDDVYNSPRLQTSIVSTIWFKFLGLMI